jgi:hypothetical protein
MEGHGTCCIADGCFNDADTFHRFVFDRDVPAWSMGQELRDDPRRPRAALSGAEGEAPWIARTLEGLEGPEREAFLRSLGRHRRTD